MDFFCIEAKMHKLETSCTFHWHSGDIIEVYIINKKQIEHYY